MTTPDIKHRAAEAIHQFNIYLSDADMTRNIHELKINLLRYERINSRHCVPCEDDILIKRTEKLENTNAFLNAVQTNNVEYLEKLYEKGYAPSGYKDISFRVAVDYESVDCLFFLYTGKCYNINVAGLAGILEIIAEKGTPSLFDKVIEKYYDYIVDNKSITTEVSNKPYTIADFYKDQHYINLTKVMLYSLKNMNIQMILHLLDNDKYKDQIDFDTLYKRHDKLYHPNDKNNYTVSSLLTRQYK